MARIGEPLSRMGARPGMAARRPKYYANAILDRSAKTRHQPAIPRSAGSRMRVEILTRGNSKGQKRRGCPIGLLIRKIREPEVPKDYSRSKDTFRPGRCDYTYHHKVRCAGLSRGGRLPGA